jgi:uncharacterized surface protein with fasciclin (FAS1) repeats
LTKEFSKLKNMTTNSIKHIVMATMVGGALAAATISCTDTWDDHYENTAVGQSGGSLWQNIEGNANLSNFARVLSATGYDRSLAGSQVFTVFAPTNSALTEADAEALIKLYAQEKADNKKENDNKAIKEFVQNHIALYNHSVSQQTDSNITMMNGKFLKLTPSKISESQFASKNQLTSNGVLFTLDKKADYFPNIYEYLISDADVDSAGHFLESFSQYEFVASSSVPGGIIDGRTWYLDSVFVLQNKLFEKNPLVNPFTLRYETMGKLNAEDSTYWMVAPTNNVWDQLKVEYHDYFNFDDAVAKGDSLQWLFTRLGILGGTVFSQTFNTDKNGAWNRDSAMSVNALDYVYRAPIWGSAEFSYFQYDKPFDEGGIFNGTTEKVCSNGKVLKSSAWKHDKLKSFYRTEIVEGETRTLVDGIDEKTTADPQRKSVSSEFKQFFNRVSGNELLVVRPTGLSAAEIRFKLPNLLSNAGYDIYVVFVPGTAIDSLSSDTVPVKFRATYNYHEQDGTYLKTYKTMYIPDQGTKQDFESKGNDIDTLLIAKDLKVPTSSFGIDPQFILKIRTSLRNADRQNHTHTANMYIDCIIVKPHEEETSNE